MGKKTVRWDELIKKTCSECNNCGIVQTFDWPTQQIKYLYCDCEWGKEAKTQQEARRVLSPAAIEQP